jgi:Domain of unknown function (DUF4145)
MSNIVSTKYGLFSQRLLTASPLRARCQKLALCYDGVMETWWELGDHSGYTGTELDIGRLRCAFCRAKGNFKQVHREIKDHSDDDSKRLYFDTLKCGNCANFLMVFWSSGSSLWDYVVVPSPLGEYTKAPDAWPSDVGKYWLQARRALGRGDNDAASVMARSALQVTLRHQQAVGSNLRAEIDGLAAKGLLPPIMKEWAHELRLLANESAHPSAMAESPSKKDVTDVVEFLEYLLQYLYSLPNRITQYRERKAGNK